MHYISQKGTDSFIFGNLFLFIYKVLQQFFQFFMNLTVAGQNTSRFCGIHRSSVKSRHFSAGLSYNQHPGRKIPWLKSGFKKASYAPTCHISQIHGSRPRPSNILTLHKDTFESLEIFMCKLFLVRRCSDSHNRIFQFICQSSMDRFSVSKTSLSFFSVKHLFPEKPNGSL